MNKRPCLANSQFIESIFSPQILAICGQLAAYIGALATITISAIAAMSVISSLTADAIIRQLQIGQSAKFLDMNGLASLHIILLVSAFYVGWSKGLKAKRKILKSISIAFPDSERESLCRGIWALVIAFIGIVSFILLLIVLMDINAIVLEGQLWFLPS